MPSPRRILSLIAVLVLAITLVPTAPASARSIYPGTQYREEFFAMGDQLEASQAGVNLGNTTLHADVLRDEDVSWAVEQPTVLVVSPYTNHSSSASDPLPTNALETDTGMHERFFDFAEATDLFEEGYTMAVVDLPGFGGSSGCNDWGGPVEQAAVSAAVEWVANQPWSNGNVALLGKSYDGWTGLMGMAQDTIHEVRGLSAVISMEPVFSGYRYGYNNGVRFTNSVLTPSIFTALDASPAAPLSDSPTYIINNTPQAYCYGVNLGFQQQDTEDSAFWRARNLVELAAGSDVPLFLTQGFLETNTKVDAAIDFWNAIDHSHGDNVLWIGQFDHVRGTDRAGNGEYLMGRDDFAAQALTFLDEHLKGIEPTEDEQLAAVYVQDNFGRFRTEASYPTADATSLVTELTTGSYGDGTGGAHLWTVSDPLAHDVWLSGEATFTASVTTTVPRGNVTVLVYDVDAEDGRARVIHQGSSLIRQTGTSQVDIQMYAQDWVVEAGNQIAVEVKDSGGGFAGWVHAPTGQTITVNSAQIALPFLTEDRTAFDEGAYQTTRLRGYNTGVSAGSVPAPNATFTLPGPIDTGDHDQALFENSIYAQQ